MLAETRLKNPAIDIVVVATDDGLDEEGLTRFLEEHRLENIEAWYFAEPDSRKLRFEVDASWYGEIPRTYFYDYDHQRVAISGMVKAEQIDAWLSAMSTR